MRGHMESGCDKNKHTKKKVIKNYIVTLEQLSLQKGPPCINAGPQWEGTLPWRVQTHVADLHDDIPTVQSRRTRDA